MKDKRHCFLYDADEEGKLLVPVPIFEEAPDGEWTARGNRAEERVISREEFIEVLEYIQELKSGMPLFEIIRTYFRSPKEVCVTAFGDPELDWLIRLETRAQEYGVLPYDGGQLDQPLYVLEAFDIITIARALFQIKREEVADAVKEKQDRLDGLKAKVNQLRNKGVNRING